MTSNLRLDAESFARHAKRAFSIQKRLIILLLRLGLRRKGVMNRGDRQKDIFRDDQYRERFLATLTESCEKKVWQTHAFCLMSNLQNLAVETPQTNLV